MTEGNRGLRLRVIAGPGAGKEMVIPPGGRSSFGSSPEANVPMPWDDRLSRKHFGIGQWEGKRWLIADLNKDQPRTLVNGEPVREQELRDGDRIEAGRSQLLVRMNPMPTPYQRILEYLRGGPPGGLFGVMDAARDPQILALLRDGGQPFASLYEGKRGADLEAVAPHLVHLSNRRLPLLDTLVHAGWGKAWGIYLHSAQPFAAVRKQLRRSLLVRVEGQPAGQRFVFRFYDPRVIATWLPTCNGGEAGALFGSVLETVWHESGPKVLVRAKWTDGTLDREELEVTC